MNTTANDPRSLHPSHHSQQDMMMEEDEDTDHDVGLSSEGGVPMKRLREELDEGDTQSEDDEEDGDDALKQGNARVLEVLQRAIQGGAPWFYAIARGRTPGVYASIEDARRAAGPGPGVRWRRFASAEEAHDYMNAFANARNYVHPPRKRPEAVVDLDLCIDICVMGFANPNELGYCATAIVDGTETRLLQVFSEKVLNDYFKLGATEKLSPSVMELLGIAHVLQSLGSNLTIPVPLRIIPCQPGPYNWIENQWTNTRPYIVELLSMVRRRVQNLTSRGSQVTFTSVGPEDANVSFAQLILRARKLQKARTILNEFLTLDATNAAPSDSFLLELKRGVAAPQAPAAVSASSVSVLASASSAISQAQAH